MHIFVIYVLLLVLVNSNRTIGELTVTATISNESVVATGFGEFVTYPFHQSIYVSCRSDPQHVDGMLELFQDDSSMEVEETPALDQMVEISSIDLEGFSERRIVFTCQLRVNTDRVRYTVENSVSLLLRAYTPWDFLCESSLGSSGTDHESSFVFCATFLSANELRWRGDNTLIDYSHRTERVDYILSSVEISEDINPMICDRKIGGNWFEVCRLPEFEIISEPTVSISPESFSANADYMSFSCQSDPPSRIRWVVTGDYGDILDYDLTVNLFEDGELDIKIQEMGGTSNITLTGSAVPFLKINTFYCVTYGRQYTKIGVAEKRSIADVTTSATAASCDCKPTTTKDEDDNDVTDEVISSVTEPFIDCKQTSQVANNDSVIDGIKGSNDTSFMIIIIILVAGILILAVTCILLYLRVKRITTTTKTSNEKDYNLDYTNSAYEPYQPSASAPYAEVTDAQYSVPGKNLYD